MKIPLLDLKAQYSAIKEEIISAIKEVLKSQHFISQIDINLKQPA